MKVKNIVFSGFMASIMMIGAASAADGMANSVAAKTLATKTYVDGAYTAAKDLVTALQTGAVKNNADDIAVLKGSGEGSVAKALADAKGYTDGKIGTLGTKAGGAAYTDVKDYVDTKIAGVGGEVGTTVDGTYVKAAKSVGENLGLLDTQVAANTTKIGTAALTTTKQNVSEAINELDAETGTLTTLTTDEKGTLVGAINEVDAHVNTNTGAIATLNADATTSGSVAYAVKQLQGNTTSTVKAVEDKIGTLTADGTYVKTTQTVDQNLAALDTQVKSNADLISDLDESKQDVLTQGDGISISDAGVISANMIDTFNANYLNTSTTDPQL